MYLVQSHQQSLVRGTQCLDFIFFFKPVNLLFIYFFANFIYLCIILHLFLAVLSFSCCAGFSLVAGSRGYSLVVVHRIFIVVASLVSEHVL